MLKSGTKQYLRPSVCYVGLCSHSAANWALWPVGHQSDMLGHILWLCGCMVVSLTCWALWLYGRHSDMLGLVSVWLSVRYVGFCGHLAVSLICWALWLYGCQSDMLGLSLCIPVSVWVWGCYLVWLYAIVS